MSKETIKKSISLRQDVYSAALEMCEKYFGGNFSSYITFLICSDKYNVSRATVSYDDTDQKIEDATVFKPDKENKEFLSAIDSILNGD